MKRLKQWQRDALILFMIWLGLAAIAAVATGGGVVPW